MTIMKELERFIENELKDFETFFKKNVQSSLPLLDLITNYLLRSKGKQFRPLLVFLSAKLHGNINHSTFVAASMIELLHTATLIHDDVVDESYQRRNLFSINALWRTKVSVLAGDYFLSKGLLLCIDNNEIEILRIVSEAVKAMSEGELMQLKASRKLYIDKNLYFEIIRKKTATLLSACCGAGAKSVNCKDEDIKKMKLFGEYLGMIFQIKDDIFDYEKSPLIGKPRGNDIKDKKITLPLICALEQAAPEERKKIISILNKKASKMDYAHLMLFVEQNGGIRESEKIMEQYAEKALDIISEYSNNEIFNNYKQLLPLLLNRNK